MIHLAHCPHVVTHGVADIRECNANNSLRRVEWNDIDYLATLTAKYNADQLRMLYNNAIAQGDAEVWMVVDNEKVKDNE